MRDEEALIPEGIYVSKNLDGIVHLHLEKRDE